MLGYWNDPEATKAVLTPDGWLNSGDIARIDEHGRITITGRLKEIIVMSTGEKVSPGDMEAAILRDSLFEQVMLVGEGRSYLGALVVLNSSHWESISRQYNLDRDWQHLLQDQKLEEILLDRISHQIRDSRLRENISGALMPEPWTIENDMLTPTLKLRRARVLDRYKSEVDQAL